MNFGTSPGREGAGAVAFLLILQASQHTNSSLPGYPDGGMQALISPFVHHFFRIESGVSVSPLSVLRLRGLRS